MIKILFFAQLREQLDCAELEWLFEKPLTLAELLQQLIEHHPQWQSFLKNEKLLMAVNQTMCSADTDVHDGDEVAFFPPVTGG